MRDRSSRTSRACPAGSSRPRRRRSCAGCSGTGSPRRAFRAGSRWSRPAGRPRSCPGRASAPSTRPCRRPHARRPARAQRAEVRERARRPVADERVLVRRARLAREDDRVVRRLVREAAVLDEVDADEVGARDRRRSSPVFGLPPAMRGRAERGGEHEDEAPSRDQCDCSHSVPSLEWLRVNPATERFGF